MAGSGRYRDLATIQYDESTADDTTEVFTGVLFSGVPCQIEAVSGYEQVRGRQIEAGTEYIVELNYVEGVEPKMRLSVTGGLFNGTILNIGKVIPKNFNGRAVKLELLCTSKRVA